MGQACPGHQMRPVELVEIRADFVLVLRGRQPAQLEILRCPVRLAPDRVGIEFVAERRIVGPCRGDKATQRVHRLLLADAVDQNDSLFVRIRHHAPRRNSRVFGR